VSLLGIMHYHLDRINRRNSWSHPQSEAKTPLLE